MSFEPIGFPSYHTEPGELTANHHDLVHYGTRSMVALLSPCVFAGACTPARVVLANPHGDAPLLCWAYPTDQGLAIAKEVDLSVFANGKADRHRSLNRDAVSAEIGWMSACTVLEE
jgi:hypothetical protein